MDNVDSSISNGAVVASVAKLSVVLPSAKKKHIHFTGTEYARPVTFIGVSENYNALFGAGKATKFNGYVISKAKAFEKKAEWMNSERNRCKEKGSHLTGKYLKGRWESYKKKYITARILGTGAGFTQEDLVKGLTTIQQKQVMLCPCYARMDAIFRDKSNINPKNTYVGLSNVFGDGCLGF